MAPVFLLIWEMDAWGQNNLNPGSELYSEACKWKEDGPQKEKFCRKYFTVWIEGIGNSKEGTLNIDKNVKCSVQYLLNWHSLAGKHLFEGVGMLPEDELVCIFEEFKSHWLEFYRTLIKTKSGSCCRIVFRLPV